MKRRNPGGSGEVIEMKARTQAEAQAHFHAGCAINEDAPKKCLEWQRGRFKTGYGAFNYLGIVVQTHRLSFELFHGRPIAEGMLLLHSCDNKKCCKPEHLREGNYQDNSDDKVSRNRQAKGETNGRAKLTETQVLEIREKHATHDNCTQKALATEYGVDPATISLIVLKKIWTHI